MTDNELIQNIKNREEESLGLLIDRYGAYVAAVIFRVSGGNVRKEDAEELAADVFVAFWKSIGQFDMGQDIKPYLAKIARNKAVSLFRKDSSLPEQTSFSLDDDIMVLERDTTDQLVIRREQKEILNEAVAVLRQPDKEIFVRFYFLGEKIDEIASRLEMNQATVKTKLHRSRGKLKEAFEERGYTCYEG